jgi:hypothetical protein
VFQFLNKWWLKMVPIPIFIFLSELWPLCVTLTLAAGTWTLHATIHLTVVNICAKLYWNPCMHVEVLLWTNVFQWPLSVTLTFDLEAWFMPATWLLIVGNISTKFSLKFLHGCRRYTLDKNWTPPAQLPARGETIIRPVFQTGV